MGTLAKMRRLHLREGVPIKGIERRTGIARNTIKTWLRKGQMVEPKYPPRVVVLHGVLDQVLGQAGIVHRKSRVPHQPLPQSGELRLGRGRRRGRIRIPRGTTITFPASAQPAQLPQSSC